MYTCTCKWGTLLYSRKLTEHCKPAIMEKIKIIIYIKKKGIETMYKNVGIGRKKNHAWVYGHDCKAI